MGCASSVGPPTIQSAPAGYNGEITGGAPPGSLTNHEGQGHPDGHLVLSDVRFHIYSLIKLS